MTIEELRDILNEILEKHPESRDQKVLIRFWNDQAECNSYETVSDVETVQNKTQKILILDGSSVCSEMQRC